MSEKELSEQIAELTSEIKKASDAAVSDPGSRGTDALRELAQKAVAFDKAKDAEQATKAEADAKAKLDEAVNEAVKAALRNVKSPSLAQAMGGGNIDPATNREIQLRGSASPVLKAIFGDDYEGGTLFSGIAAVRGIGGFDLAAHQAGKASLDKLGVFYADLPPSSKATLGTTNATGGYVLPNNLVDSVVKPSTQSHLPEPVHRRERRQRPGRGPAVPPRRAGPRAVPGLGHDQGERERDLRLVHGHPRHDGPHL